jgi:2-aminoadipate transaminase
MPNTVFNFAPLLRPNLPPAAVKYAGFPPFNFVGGHNDAATTPVDGLIVAATSVLKREGATLATYGLNSGPLGYIGLRQFLSKKLHRQHHLQHGRDLDHLRFEPRSRPDQPSAGGAG